MLRNLCAIWWSFELKLRILIFVRSYSVSMRHSYFNKTAFSVVLDSAKAAAGYSSVDILLWVRHARKDQTVALLVHTLLRRL